MKGIALKQAFKGLVNEPELFSHDKTSTKAVNEIEPNVNVSR